MNWLPFFFVAIAVIGVLVGFGLHLKHHSFRVEDEYRDNVKYNKMVDMNMARPWYSRNNDELTSKVDPERERYVYDKNGKFIMWSPWNFAVDIFTGICLTAICMGLLMMVLSPIFD